MVGVPVVIARVVATRISMHGDAGAVWAEQLPSIIEASSRRWSLTIGEPFPGLIYNYAAPVRRDDGTELVLKVKFPDAELATEIAALELIDGDGAVRLLEADQPSGALLLERLLPGTSLPTVDDEAATAILAATMRRVRRPVPAGHGFLSIGAWLEGFQRLRDAHSGDTGPIPAEVVSRAERLSAELQATTPEPVVLHGDLHHGNVLAAEREPWLAIDPSGVIGDPACEAAPMLRNRLPAGGHDQRRRLIDRRLGQLADLLDIERERLRDWGIVLNTLSMAWNLEDHGSLDHEALAAVEALSRL